MFGKETRKPAGYDVDSRTQVMYPPLVLMMSSLIPGQKTVLSILSVMPETSWCAAFQDLGPQCLRDHNAISVAQDSINFVEVMGE